VRIDELLSAEEYPLHYGSPRLIRFGAEIRF
jgi:hypothetical protein